MLTLQSYKVVFINKQYIFILYLKDEDDIIDDDFVSTDEEDLINQSEYDLKIKHSFIQDEILRVY